VPSTSGLSTARSQPQSARQKNNVPLLKQFLESTFTSKTGHSRAQSSKSANFFLTARGEVPTILPSDFTTERFAEEAGGRGSTFTENE
jgi:hypothetical protein